MVKTIPDNASYFLDPQNVLYKMKNEESPDIFSQAAVKKTDKAKTLWQRRASADRRYIVAGYICQTETPEYFRFNLRIIRDGKGRIVREEQGQRTHAFVLTDNLVLTVLPVRHLSINRDNASRQIGARLHVLHILHSAAYPMLRNRRNINCTCKNVNNYRTDCIWEDDTGNYISFMSSYLD